jgi:uncharacterized spore protein YtfJ
MKIDEIIQSVTEKVEKTANVKVVFGDPVKEGKLTIIPVAKTSVKGGGGGGSGEEKTKGKGGGIGLGLMVKTTPMGYIKVKDGKAEFVEIIDKSKIMMGGLILGGIVLLILGRALARK